MPWRVIPNLRDYDRLRATSMVILIGDDHGPTRVRGTVDYARLMSDASDRYAIQPTGRGPAAEPGAKS